MTLIVRKPVGFSPSVDSYIPVLTLLMSVPPFASVPKLSWALLDGVEMRQGRSAARDAALRRFMNMAAGGCSGGLALHRCGVCERRIGERALPWRVDRSGDVRACSRISVTAAMVVRHDAPLCSAGVCYVSLAATLPQNAAMAVLENEGVVRERTIQTDVMARSLSISTDMC
jgi:hypothetical protein